MIDLDTLERLAGEATEGPWMVADDDNDGPRQVVSYAYGEELVCETFTNRPENAAFIAAARTAIPELVAEVRRLREGLERVAPLAVEAEVGNEERIEGIVLLARNLLAGKRWDGMEADRG